MPGSQAELGEGIRSQLEDSGRLAYLAYDKRDGVWPQTRSWQLRNADKTLKRQ